MESPFFPHGRLLMALTFRIICMEGYVYDIVYVRILVLEKVTTCVAIVKRIHTDSTVMSMSPYLERSLVY